MTLSNRYRVRREDFKSHHGRGLLAVKYHDSPAALVMTVYHDYPYLPWLFGSTPTGYFDQKENRLKYIEWLVKKTGKPRTDLKANDFKENSGHLLLRKYGHSPNQILQSLESIPGNTVLTLKRPKNHWVRIFFIIAFLNK